MTFNLRLARALPYALVGAAAGYLYYVAAHFEFHQRAGTLGPDFWPKAVLVLTLAACVFEVVRTLFFGNATAEIDGVLEEIVEKSAEQHGDSGAPIAAERHPVWLVLGMAATLAYVAVVQKLGFFLSTSVYLAFFLAIGGYRRWGVLAATSVIGALVLMFIFMKLVYVSLPIGEAPFSAVTLFLMQAMGIR